MPAGTRGRRRPRKPKTRKPTAPPTKVFKDRSKLPERKQKHRKPAGSFTEELG